MNKNPAMLSCAELMEVRTLQRRKAEWYQRVRLCISDLVTHILKPRAPEIGCFCSQISTLCAQLPMLAEGEVCLNDERIKMSKTGFPLVPNTSRFKGKGNIFVFLLIRFIRLQARQRNPAGITEMISPPPHRKPFQESGFCKEIMFFQMNQPMPQEETGGSAAPVAMAPSTLWTCL